MTRTKKAPYGQCPVCVSPIVYPGLDGFKCVECGWLKTSEIALIQKKRALLARSTKQSLTSNAGVVYPSSSVENPEIVTCNSS
jgi:hypothetical protein